MDQNLAATTPIALLYEIRSRADDYFGNVIAEMTQERQKEILFAARYDDDLWRHLSDANREAADDISRSVVGLAHLVAPAIQRSALLTETDERVAGFALKGMRAALRLMRFVYHEMEVLNDEDRVLGIRPPSEHEVSVTPVEAQEIFKTFSLSLMDRLELADPQEIGVHDRGVVVRKPIPAGWRPGTAFIMMWMSKEIPALVDVVNTVKACFKEFGIEAVRSDDIEHEDVITERILNEIRTAEFLFADLSGERPSVYYEVGYAQALERRVMLYRKTGTPIHFDLAAYNCPEYSNLTELKTMLMKRLENVTGAPPTASS